MSFTSLEYFLFLTLVFLAYHATNRRYRWVVALVASYVFFALIGAPQTLAALGLVTVVSYAFGLLLATTSEARLRTLAFWFGSGICALILVAVKYLPSVFPSLTPASSYAFLLNSIGVSYFVFQAISYLADVYLETQSPERNLGAYALSLAFFPKIAQGPIERAGDILPQIHNSKPFDYESIRSGILLFAFGLAKKLVIADRLAQFTNTVYGNPEAYTGLPILIATYAYAFQIYFDFSGYTDMARGSARLFGIELSQNFQSPYMATSIPEFWRRWHISFSRWILDYLFKPLQMLWRDMGKSGTALALIVAFLISGVWHGAKAGFIIWGALHGLYLAASVFYTPWRTRRQKRLGIIDGKLTVVWRRFFTFNLVCLAWVFFRANSLDDALYAVTHILDIGGSVGVLRHIGFARYVQEYILLGNGYKAAIIVLFAISVSILVCKCDPAAFWRRPTWIRWCAYYGIVIAVLRFAAPSAKFIYFQF